jgi:hypothetical protein
MEYRNKLSSHHGRCMTEFQEYQSKESKQKKMSKFVRATSVLGYDAV